MALKILFIYSLVHKCQKMSKSQPHPALKKTSTSSNPSLRDVSAHFSGSLTPDEDDNLHVSNPPNIDLTLSITVPPQASSDHELYCEPLTRPHSGSFGASTLAAPRVPSAPILKRKSRSMSERGARGDSEADSCSPHLPSDLDAEHGAVAKSLSSVVLSSHNSRSRSPSPHNDTGLAIPPNHIAISSAPSSYVVISPCALSPTRNSPPPSAMRSSPPLSQNQQSSSPTSHLAPGSPTSGIVRGSPRERDWSPSAASSSARCLTRDASASSPSPRDARLRPHRSVETDTLSLRPSSITHTTSSGGASDGVLGVDGESGQLALDSGDHPTDALALETGQTLRLSSTSTSTNARFLTAILKFVMAM